MSQREYPAAPIVGVGAIVIRDGHVLLARRGHPPLQGEWSLPGGALELGETLRNGCAREVLEETGLQVDVLELVELIDRIVLEESAGAAARVQYHYVLADYLCTVISGDLQAATDATDVRWVTRSDIAAGSLGIADLARRVIEKAFQMLEERSES
jgi:8-oxo-dGTP diphosphatase